jgi:hypothetical protein
MILNWPPDFIVINLSLACVGVALRAARMKIAQTLRYEKSLLLHFLKRDLP